MQQGEAVGFLTGFLHPISGLDHVLAMVAVGLWGAQLGAPAIWVLPVAFPLVMAMGGMLGFLSVPVPGTEYGIAASAILLGVAVMFEARPPLAAAALIVGIFAIFHGHAHGTELPPGESALLYSMGFVATGCLHAVGIGIGTVHRWTCGVCGDHSRQLGCCCLCSDLPRCRFRGSVAAILGSHRGACRWQLDCCQRHTDARLAPTRKSNALKA